VVSADSLSKIVVIGGPQVVGSASFFIPEST
jgi:hypothetical protein